MFDKDSLPKKSLFKAEEVCSIIGIKPYILRFWESEFIEIRPLVSASGKKLYERKDLRLIGLVKKLLFEEKLTIEKVKATVQNLSKTHNIQELETDSKLTNIKENETASKQLDLTDLSTNKDDINTSIKNLDLLNEVGSSLLKTGFTLLHFFYCC